MADSRRCGADAKLRDRGRREARGRARRRAVPASRSPNRWPQRPATPEVKPFSSLVPAIIGAAMLMQTLSATVIANALPSMAVTLHEDPVQLNTTISVYLLALGGLPAGQRLGGRPLRRQARLPDRHRPLRRLVRGLRLCHTTCPSCCWRRVAEGAAGALMGPVGRLVLLRSTPKHDLVRAMSVLTMPSMLGPVIGPPIGGFIVTYLLLALDLLPQPARSPCWASILVTQVHRRHQGGGRPARSTGSA